jgi:D-alanyl-D-alanine carboxypeptidase/D-alanyl-D-alanine-endopeptidase (penicillin-binding protein 4)
MNLSIAPPVSDVRLINHTKTQSHTTVDIRREGQSNVYLVTGGADRVVALDSKPVVNPAAFFADAMRMDFASRDIHIAGRDLPAPPGAVKLQTLAIHDTRLADAIHRMDKDSQNLFAEALCKLVGQSYATDELHENLSGSWPLGFAAIEAFLARNNIDTRYFQMVDGSGLSRDDHVTVRQVTNLLSLMWHNRARQAFFDSLPVAGVDGTLRHRMGDIAGKVHAKTGYIHGVRSLSGYLFTHDGRTLAFSIIFNKIPGSVRPYEAIQDRICEQLVRAN